MLKACYFGVACALILFQLDLLYKTAVAYAGFSKGGGQEFENYKEQNQNFPAQNQVRFPAQT